MFLPRKNNQYEIIKKRSDFLLKSYKGGIEYTSDSNNLFQYVTEGNKKYQRRQERAVLYNYFRPIVDSFSNAIFEREIIRNAKKEQSLRFIENATTDGKSLTKVMRTISILSTFIRVGLLVDSPRTDYKEVPKDVKVEQRLYPYVKIIMPDRIVNWNYDEKGLQWVIIDESYLDNSDYRADKEVEINKFKLWTREFWQEIEVVKGSEGTKEIWGEEIPHGLSRLPFMFAEQNDIDDDKNWESTVEDIAMLQRRIYNLMSSIDENIYSTCHSALMVAYDKNFDKIMDVIQGSQEGLNVIPYPAGSVPAQYLRTDLVNISMILSVGENDRKEIYRMLGAYLNEQDFFSQSGKAKIIDLKDTDALLSVKSMSLQDIENWVLALDADYENITLDEDEKSVYPTEFHSADLVMNLKKNMDISSLNISSTLNKYINKQIVDENYPEMPEETRQEVDKEIDESSGTVITEENTGGMPDFKL